MTYQPQPITEESTRAVALKRAQDYAAFLDDSPCNLYAVKALSALLDAHGFVALDESDPFQIEAGGRYYFRRNGTALVAFVAGQERPSKAGFHMVGAHTDSPGFRVKPNAEYLSQGMVCLGVEKYGGPIVATWTDRDFGLCGEVLVERDGQIVPLLYRSEGPVVSIPNVAIHQNRKANDEGLCLNVQTELTVVLGSVAEGLPEEGALRWLLARDLGIEVEAIVDHDLYLFDTQKSSFAGVFGEYLRSGRHDDLGMCFAGITALVAVADQPASATRLAVCYDSEEVGSRTAQGAQSTLLPHALERIALALGDSREGYLASLTRSVLVSADNAHAIHPGYTSKMEPRHAPVLNGGPVIKLHASRAYATTGRTSAVFAEAAKRAGVPVQRFVNRSDVRSGGTIGSMTAAQLGVATVDVGNPQYAMHSVREMAGTWDVHYMIEALSAFYQR